MSVSAEQPEDTAAELSRHWDAAYARAGAERVSWHQDDPVLSLSLFDELEVRSDTPVIDVGGGTSVLVDRLVERGFTDVSVVDASPVALALDYRAIGAEPAVLYDAPSLKATKLFILSPGYPFKHMVYGHPLVRIKTASSLDGRTALSNGESKWITGEAARADVHRLRARCCAILTGIETVLADNPQLNVRGIETVRQPIKVIVDSTLRTPPDAEILKGAKTLIACALPDTKKAAALEAAGAEILCLPGADGKVDLPALLSRLAQKGVNEVMTEAGPRLNGALVAAGLADEWVQYVAPCLLGAAARPLETMGQVPSDFAAETR